MVESLIQIESFVTPTSALYYQGEQGSLESPCPVALLTD